MPSSKTASTEVPTSQPASDEGWNAPSAVLRKFLALHPRYEKLAEEVAYALKAELSAAHVEFASITSRAKSIESFLWKNQRKSYADPFREITDFAGARVVYLYSSDFEAISALIRNNFEVLETVEKREESGTDRFGYLATHFLVRVGERFSGPRYNELKQLICEIQVRTALQDAWAVISHHLVYKSEQETPVQLRRRINALAGLLETADDQFDRLRAERSKYIADLSKAATDEVALLQQGINLDSVQLFLERKYPSISFERREGALQTALSDLNRERYRTLGDLDSMLRRTSKAIDAYYTDLGRPPVSGAAILAVGLALEDPSHRRIGWDKKRLALLERNSALVEREA